MRDFLSSMGLVLDIELYLTKYEIDLMFQVYFRRIWAEMSRA